jgi:hypothetical protein
MPVVSIMVFFLAVSSIYSIYAQNDIGNTTNNKDPSNKIPEFDDMLGPNISATLTGLSLAGASFLLNLGKDTNESDAAHVHRARKFFLKAFFMFLFCTILLFIFDFLQIIDDKEIIMITILDVIITYSLFGVGSIYLAKAAVELYVTYGR